MSVRSLILGTLGALLVSSGAAAAGPVACNPAPDAEGCLTLYFSDGSAPLAGLDAVNQKLREVGVRVSRIDLPADTRPLLATARRRALTQPEARQLLDRFRLDRPGLLAEIAAAGRLPAVPGGGELQTGEDGVPPYPKLYDMRAMDPATVRFVQRKFGRLHVNSSAAGVGIDEVMTIVGGGPYTWFFVFPDDTVGKLRLGVVRDGGSGWRISYPGLVPHGGYFDAADGLVVAYAHGPARFVMRYEDPGVPGGATLNDNPWIEFAADGDGTRLLQQPRVRAAAARPLTSPRSAAAR